MLLPASAPGCAHDSSCWHAQILAPVVARTAPPGDADGLLLGGSWHGRAPSPSSGEDRGGHDSSWAAWIDSGKLPSADTGGDRGEHYLFSWQWRGSSQGRRLVLAVAA
jgi:hypothetical protein